MNKKIPKVYVKQNKKINNNKEVFYSFKDEFIEMNDSDMDSKTVKKVIGEIFSSKDFVYKKRIYVKTSEFDGEAIIVYKTPDYLLTIDNKKIYIADIKSIRNM